MGRGRLRLWRDAPALQYMNRRPPGRVIRPGLLRGCGLASAAPAAFRSVPRSGRRPARFVSYGAVSNALPFRPVVCSTPCLRRRPACRRREVRSRPPGLAWSFLRRPLLWLGLVSSGQVSLSRCFIWSAQSFAVYFIVICHISTFVKLSQVRYWRSAPFGLAVARSVGCQAGRFSRRALGWLVGWSVGQSVGSLLGRLVLWGFDAFQRWPRAGHRLRSIQFARGFGLFGRLLGRSFRGSCQ